MSCPITCCLCYCQAIRGFAPTEFISINWFFQDICYIILHNYKKKGNQWCFLSVKKSIRWRFSKASFSPLSLYVLVNNDASRKCHIWFILSITLKEVSSLNNVNDDTYKCVIFEYFLLKSLDQNISMRIFKSNVRTNIGAMTTKRNHHQQKPSSTS